MLQHQRYLHGGGAAGHGPQSVVCGVPRKLHQHVDAVPPDALCKGLFTEGRHVVPRPPRLGHRCSQSLGFGVFLQQRMLLVACLTNKAASIQQQACGVPQPAP